MRKTNIAGILAGALVFTSLAVPAKAQEAPADNSNASETDTTAPVDPAEALQDTIENFAKLSDATSSSNEGADGTETDGGLIDALDQDPENDPLYIDPEKNPLKKVSSSEMFLEWTDGMAEGEGKDVVQAWAANSSIPDTANPIELWKAEAQGSAQMSSGLFTGDFAQSSAGSSQSTSVWLTVVIGVMVVGQLIELVMRGVRMAQQ